jgi:sulfhydrogenase subunit beta (sulfur reductase)
VTLKAIPKTDMTCILNTWKKEYRMLTPQRGTDGFTEFGEWDGDGTGFLDGYRNTVVPGKTLFLPPFEELFRFKKGTSGHYLEIPAAPERKTLIFGIRPCDARALSLLDQVLAGRMPDPYYLPRRERTLLVGLGCRQPYDTCFCTSLDGDPFNTRDVDLLLTDTGREFVVKASTRAGAALLDEGMPVGEAGPAAEARSSRIATAARKQITRGRPFSKMMATGWQPPRGALAAVFVL